MSIIINGMEMPKHCAMCGFHKRMDDPMISQHWCGISGKTILSPYKTRADDCPLVPVPKHGDLIDRDKLEKDIDRYIGGEESKSRFHHWVQVQSAVIPRERGAEK